jgi:uncharacterized protein YyaL (SSP411 family)
MEIRLLLRLWRRFGDDEALQMATKTLDGMALGGIYDQLGGGFHRYSVDERWLVPHFEKMLYDNAQLSQIYLDAFRITGQELFRRVAEQTLDYILREMTAEQGGFYAAQDADSEGEEGKFYVWTPAELTAVLGESGAAPFAAVYGVTREGNFEHGTSILHRARPLAQVAAEFRLSPHALEARLGVAREKLLEARGRRVRPHRDDKVLVSWTGLMISALARGARVLDDPELARQATRAAEFVGERLFDERTGELRRRWRDGHTAGAGQLDDYAYYAHGLIDLYGATFDPRWLERAVTVMDAAVKRFWDEAGGGFFESPAGDPSIKVRMKNDFDGAELAGNSIAVTNLLVLAALLDRDDWREKARRTLDAYARRLDRNPIAMPQMLAAMDLERAPQRHVVIAGREGAEDTRALIREFDRRFLPHDALLVVDRPEHRKRLAALAPFAAALEPMQGRATAYVCLNYACRLPTTDLAAFAAQLDERPQPRRAGEPVR